MILYLKWLLLLRIDWQALFPLKHDFSEQIAFVPLISNFIIEFYPFINCQMIFELHYKLFQ